MTVIQIFREKWGPGILAIAHKVLELGLPFHTVCFKPRVPHPVLVGLERNFWMGDKSDDLHDYDVYVAATQDSLEGPWGCAALQI